MTILVEADASEEWDRSSDWAALATRAVQAAIAASNHAGLTDAPGEIEVSVRFGSDAEVQALNGQWRGKDKPTNVLSFPMLEAEDIGRAGALPGGAMLGDIILAHGVCASEAADKGIGMADHASHLIVHGTLHLLGYDHETGDADAEAMEAIERHALDTIGIADPYALEIQ